MTLFLNRTNSTEIGLILTTIWQTTTMRFADISWVISWDDKLVVALFLQGILLKIQIYDDNFGNAPDDLIDQFQMVMNQPLGTTDQEIKYVHQRPGILEPTT